jgi:hypothetical protein
MRPHARLGLALAALALAAGAGAARAPAGAGRRLAAEPGALPPAAPRELLAEPGSLVSQIQAALGGKDSIVVDESGMCACRRRALVARESAAHTPYHPTHPQVAPDAPRGGRVAASEFSCNLVVPVEAENSQPTNQPITHRQLPE